MEGRTLGLDGCAVLELSGRIDATNAKAAEEMLLGGMKDTSGPFVVDMAAVEYVSSAGLRVILVGAKAAQAAGRPFRLCALRAPVREVFDVSGFSRIIPIFAARDEAVAA
jgi:anti-sigma B factor antagonist